MAMSLKVASLITCVLFSGCLSELTGKSKLPDNIEKRVREANTQDDVGYDPYSDWFNNAPDANLQDNLNTADESLVARQRQNVNGLNWGKAEEQDDDKASDSDEWDFGEVKQQGDGENTDSKPSEDVDDIMIQFFNHPGDPKVQKEVHWNDRDFLKEEVEKARKQGVYLDDQNDDKTIFQNDAWNSIWGDDSNVEQQSNDHDSENGYVETERGKQDNLQHEQTDNTANQQMLEKNYNTNNLEDLWDELNGMQQVGTQKNAQDDVNRKIDETFKKAKDIDAKLTHAIEEERQAKLLIRCKTKTGIDEGCRLKEEKVAKEFGDKIKRYKEQLEALEDKLDKLGK